MAESLDRSVLRILAPGGQVVGAGFLVAPHLAVTCAHVARLAQAAAGESIRVRCYASGQELTAKVLPDGVSAVEDVAFLELESESAGLAPVALGTAVGRAGHDFLALGFAPVSNRPTRGAVGQLAIPVDVPERAHTCLQMAGAMIDPGMSGGPVLDLETGRVVGMVTDFPADPALHEHFAYATTADALVALSPRLLLLWPDDFGPDTWALYLNHLVEAHRWLTLPGAERDRVPLERLYVSLRADQMNAAERGAEKEFYDQQVKEALIDVSEEIAGPGDAADYARHTAMRRVVARNPKMQMLIARDWTTLFGPRNETSLNLAEVVQRHECVVLLGDPGSGKTTLGRWLTLQLAQALLRGDERLVVRTDQVHAGQGAGAEIDLGPPRVPLFVRIADYARARWSKVQGDSGLALKDFIVRGQLDSRTLPLGLFAQAVGAIGLEALQQGQALVILDGLDEVTNPDERREVMVAVSDFIDAHQTSGNRLLLTSRVIGYQFRPLTHLPHYTVEDMGEPSIGAFCQAWMAHVHGDAEAPERGAKLRDAILNHSHPGIKALAGNPLLLTLLAQVYRESGERTLPARRVALFEETFRAMYRQREGFWDRHNITERRLRRALGEVAYHIHAHEVTGFAERGTVKACLRRVFDEDQAEVALAAAEQASGFLVSRGEGVYGFLHRALQEYFVACHLTRESEEVIDRLRVHLLDAAWNEPLVLAVGIVSGADYESADPELLKHVITSLLDAPDPAGEILPRRELLVSTAVVECERVPDGSTQLIASRLLRWYADREGYGKALSLRESIQRAFSRLGRSSLRREVERLLCAALLNPNFDLRYAAIDLIIGANWDSREVAQALMDSNRMYDGPAGSLLIALEQLHERRPDLLTADILPFRWAVEAHPELWQRFEGHPEWNALVRVLYLPPGAAFAPGNIFRDSALTQYILGALDRGLSDVLTITALRDDLRLAARETGTVLASESKLALSVLDDRSWVSDALDGTWGGLGSHRFLLARLWFTCASALDIASVIALDLVSVRTPALAIAHALVSALDNDLDPARALVRALDRDRDIVLDNDRYRVVDAASILARANTSAGTRDRALASALASASASARVLDRARARTLDRALYGARARALDLALHGARALDLARALGEHPDIAELTQRLQSALIAAQRSLPAEAAATIAIASALDHLARLQNEVADPIYSRLRSVWNAVAERLAHADVADLQERADGVYQVHGKGDWSRSMVLELSSGDDFKRTSARRVFARQIKASDMGKEGIELVAELSHRFSKDSQIVTHLDWALASIVHDCVDWIRDWIQDLEQAQAERAKEHPAGLILSHICNPESGALAEILDALPSRSKAVNEEMLIALSWIFRLGEIPAWMRRPVHQKLANWLQGESDAKTRKDILETFSQLRGSEEEVGWWLIVQFESGLLTVQDGYYPALARLASRSNAFGFVATIHERLESACRKHGSNGDSAHVRLLAARGMDKSGENDTQTRATRLFARLSTVLDKPERIFKALMDAGTDDDVWSEKYHAILTRAVQLCLEAHPELVRELVKTSRQNLAQTHWPPRRMALASLAACAEVLPRVLQNECPDLEVLLTNAAQDPNSFNARRFALTALSYLHQITPLIVPVLLAGCQDIGILQIDAIEAARRFRTVKGDVLPTLVSALTGESVSTAYAVAQLLGALGTNTAAVALRPAILQGLADALRNAESSKREVVLYDDRDSHESKGPLADALYSALLRVAGWAG